MLKRFKLPHVFQGRVFFFKYLFSCNESPLWHVESVVAARGIYFPNQGLNLGPLCWDCRVLATGPPGKSPGKGKFKGNIWGAGYSLWTLFLLVGSEVTGWCFRNLNHQRSGSNQSGVYVLVVSM